MPLLSEYCSYRIIWKRLFDILAALLGIIVVSPLLLIAALVVKFGSIGPIIYSQQRIGKDFKPFIIYKFRSMHPGSDVDGNTCTVEADPRITTVGRLLRKTKLDELPQLFNVIKGEMSLVGPRPEVARYVEMFKEDYKTILNVRPGITDYAAIEYSNEEAMLARYTNPQNAYVKEILPAKIKLYKQYIGQMSFIADLKIIAKTLIKIVN